MTAIAEVPHMTDGQAEAAANLAMMCDALAAACDGAVSDDGRGFNKADAANGRAFARLPIAAWTPEDVWAAWDMLRKYAVQLAGMGFDIVDVPEPDKPARLEDAEDPDEAAAAVREHARVVAAAQDGYLRLDTVDGRDVIVLRNPVFNPDVVAACRQIPGRRYRNPAVGVKAQHPAANLFPLPQAAAAVALADRFFIPVDDDVRALAANPPEPVKPPAPAMRVTLGRTRLRVETPYSEELTQVLRPVAPWNKAKGCRFAAVNRGPELADIATRFGLVLAADGDAAAVIELERVRQARNRELSRAATGEPVEVPGLADGVVLLPHQHVAVRFAMANRRFMLADTMGLGKSIESLACLAATGATPAVVTCPSNLTGNWEAEIARFFPTWRMFTATGTTPTPVPDETDVVVVGYAVLAAWADTLTAWRPAGLVVDEGHLGRNKNAQRSQALADLGASVADRDGVVVELTGTAVVNRPRDLVQQLKTIGRLADFGGERDFLFRYTNAHIGRAGYWTFDGASHLGELHDRLVAYGVLCRRGKEVLDLPPCTTETWLVARAELDPEVMGEYDAAQAALTERLAAELAAARRAHGDTGAAKSAFHNRMAEQQTEILPLLTRLRELAALAKRDAVTAWVRERVAQGEKVMVAAHHRAMVDAFAAEFGGLKIQGGQSTASKEDHKHRFQTEPVETAPVISVAIGAGGLGHTLTAARLGVQAEMPWTPAEMDQMRDRLHRIGQTRPVTYTVALAEGTIDLLIEGRVVGKRAIADKVLDGAATSVGKPTSVAFQVAYDLADRALTAAATAELPKER